MKSVQKRAAKVASDSKGQHSKVWKAQEKGEEISDE